MTVQVEGKHTCTSVQVDTHICILYVPADLNDIVDELACQNKRRLKVAHLLVD